MIYKIYVILDTALEAFLVPMFFQSEGAARRAFTDEVNRVDDKNMLNKHSEHFSLYYCGDYSDETGMMNTQAPMFVCSAESVKL